VRLVRGTLHEKSSVDHLVEALRAAGVPMSAVSIEPISGHRAHRRWPFEPVSTEHAFELRIRCPRKEALRVQDLLERFACHRVGQRLAWRPLADRSGTVED
jgi:hypothetical protein